MRVAVIGAAGRTGRRIVSALRSEDRFAVTALVRRSHSHVHPFPQGMSVLQADVEGSMSTLVEVLAGHDAVVFAATGEYDGADRMLSVDLDGAVKSMDAAEKVGARRFVLVSGLWADRPERWTSGFTSSWIAKHYSERLLMSSQLDWTIVRPGGLTESPGTGMVRTSVTGDLHDTTIARDDVAAFIAALLSRPESIRKAFDLLTGTTPIADAVLFGGENQ